MLPWQGRRIDGDPDETPAVRVYLGYLHDRPDSIVAALRDVTRAPGAALVHCAAGKDRTGVVCALALDTVGVSRAAVVEDYVATGERLSGILRRLRSSLTYAGDLDGRPDDSTVRGPATCNACSRSTPATAARADSSRRTASEPPSGTPCASASSRAPRPMRA